MAATYLERTHTSSLKMGSRVRSAARALALQCPVAKTRNNARPNPRLTPAMPTTPTHSLQNTPTRQPMDASPLDKLHPARKPKCPALPQLRAHRQWNARLMRLARPHSRSHERHARRGKRSAPTHQCRKHNQRQPKLPLATLPTPIAMPAPKQPKVRVSRKNQSWMSRQNGT